MTFLRFYVGPCVWDGLQNAYVFANFRDFLQFEGVFEYSAFFNPFANPFLTWLPLG